MSKRKLPAAKLPDRPAVKTEFSSAAMKGWRPDIQAAVHAEGGEHTISIMDPIGADFWGEGIMAKNVSNQLRRFGTDADVTVLINSPGGNFFEGLAIYNVLREHKGIVTIKILGMAASAAAVIAMAGNEIQIARASFIMIHNTWVSAAGDRHSFREVADWLEPFDKTAAGIYQARTGISQKEIAKMLDKETWIAGDDAVEQGFADDFLPSDEIVEGVENFSELSPLAAQKKLNIYLAQSKVSKSERRDLYAALKGGKSRAATSGKSRAAAKKSGAEKLLAIIKKL
jgi:ATP-dependent Clp protease, protease subunit